MVTIQDKTLKNIFHLILGVSLLVIMATNLFIYPYFKKTQIEQTESEAIMVANHLSEMIFPDKGAALFITHIVQNINPQIDKFVKTFSLYKLKIFVSSGEVVYSTDQKDVGILNKHGYFHNEVANGEVYTKIVNKLQNSLEGKKIEIDVVETYVPIMRDDQFIGALEIYYDISNETQVIHDAVLLFNIVGVVILISFILIFLVVVRKLDMNISEKKNAREFLKMTNLDLKHEIEQRIKTEKEKEELITELEKTLLNLNILKGLVPICSFCKNIRNDSGFWEKMEEYVEKHSDAEFSHGLCPNCAVEHYPDLHLDEDDEAFTKRQEGQKKDDTDETPSKE